MITHNINWAINMKNKSQNNIDTKLQQLGQMLGLTGETVADMLHDNLTKIEQSSLTFGPDPYGGGYYGTISIHDCINCKHSRITQYFE